MTDEAVVISITIRVSEMEIKIEKEVKIEDMEETIQRMMLEAGQQTFGMGIKVMDERIAEKIPKGWQNVGTEERWLVSSVGALRYKRRVYLDENKKRRKPLDEKIGIKRYGRMSERVEEMGASLACMGTYRLAASQISWLIKTNPGSGHCTG